MFEYFPAITMHELWLDVALDGAKCGYIYKPYDSAFYEANTIQTDVHFMKSFTTLERAKAELEKALASEVWDDEVTV